MSKELDELRGQHPGLDRALTQLEEQAEILTQERHEMYRKGEVKIEFEGFPDLEGQKDKVGFYELRS